MNTDTILHFDMSPDGNNIFAIGNEGRVTAISEVVLYYNNSGNSAPQTFEKRNISDVSFDMFTEVRALKATVDGCFYFCTNNNYLYYSINNGATVEKIEDVGLPTTPLNYSMMAVSTGVYDGYTYDIIFLYSEETDYFITYSIKRRTTGSFIINARTITSIANITSIASQKNLIISLVADQLKYSFSFGYCVSPGDIHIGSEITTNTPGVLSYFLVPSGFNDTFTSLEIGTDYCAGLITSSLDGSMSILKYKLIDSMSWNTVTLQNNTTFLSLDSYRNYAYVCTNSMSSSGSYGYVDIPNNNFVVQFILPNINNFIRNIRSSSASPNLVYLSIRQMGLYFSVENTSFSQSVSCFYKGTLINTPDGFKKIEDLKTNDDILLFNNKITKIKSINKFYNKKTSNRLFCIKKNSIEQYIPFEDLYLSEGHAIIYKNKYHHCHHSNLAKNVIDCPDILEFYHIELSDWFTQTINANGVECESYFQLNKEYELEWTCRDGECKFKIK